MKTLIALAFGFGLALRASTIPVVTVPVSANATFLADSPLDVCFSDLTCDFNPTLVTLSSVGLAPGDEIGMSASGWFCVYDTPDCDHINAVDRVLGVFIGPGGFVQSAAPGYATGHTWIGDIATDIPQDFKLPVWVVIPTGATGVELMPEDSAFGDNHGAILVEIEKRVAEVPEPNGLDLMLAGLLAVGIAWRKTT